MVEVFSCIMGRLVVRCSLRAVQPQVDVLYGPALKYGLGSVNTITVLLRSSSSSDHRAGLTGICRAAAYKSAKLRNVRL